MKTLAEAIREHVAQALVVANGNKAAAARMLGVDRRTIYRLITRHKVSTEPPPPPEDERLFPEVA